MKTKILLAVLFVFAIAASAKKKPETFTELQLGANNNGSSITLQFERGKQHNHPLFAVWLADEKGNSNPLHFKKHCKGLFRKRKQQNRTMDAG